MGLATDPAVSLAVDMAAELVAGLVVDIAVTCRGNVLGIPWILLFTVGLLP